MKNTIMRDVASAIVRAQACSDAGKYIYKLPLNENSSRQLIKRKYEAKDEQILKAIHIILRHTSEKAGARYDVVKCTEGDAPYLVYFTYCIDAQRRQVSFHTFSEKVGKFCRKSKVRWDHKNSRKNCEELIQYFELR